MFQRFPSPLNRMERWQYVFTKTDTDFKELFGIKKETFRIMLAILTLTYQQRH